MKALRIFLVILGLAGPLAARAAAHVDWLLDPSAFKARVARSADGGEVVLDNGLVRRAIRLTPNAATVSFENLMTGESIIRAVRPEACVGLDGVRYEIGGLGGQPVQGFLEPAWVETLKANPAAFQFAGLKTGQTQARFPWKKRREWMPKDAPWPPPGVSRRRRPGCRAIRAAENAVETRDRASRNPAGKRFSGSRHGRNRPGPNPVACARRSASAAGSRRRRRYTAGNPRRQAAAPATSSTPKPAVMEQRKAINAQTPRPASSKSFAVRVIIGSASRKQLL